MATSLSTLEVPDLLTALVELTGRIEGLLSHESDTAELWRKVGFEHRRAVAAIDAHKTPKPKRAVLRIAPSKEEKKSLQDAVKCTAAIAILQRRIADTHESSACKVAFQFEIERLTLALEQREANPYKLKRIFRRKET